MLAFPGLGPSQAIQAEVSAPASPAQEAEESAPSLDSLAMAAAERLMQSPQTLNLAAANGLERFGVRRQREDWIEAARQVFESRLADSRPLTPEEAGLFVERFQEIDLDPRWRSRALADGYGSLVAARPSSDPRQALVELQAALESGSDGRFLRQWGRIHAWHGHVWTASAHLAIGYDGFVLRRALHQEEEDDLGPGWIARDLVGSAREYTLRRADGHDSMRYTEAGGRQFLPDRLAPEGGDGHQH